MQRDNLTNVYAFSASKFAMYLVFKCLQLGHCLSFEDTCNILSNCLVDARSPLTNIFCYTEDTFLYIWFNSLITKLKTQPHRSSVSVSLSQPRERPRLYPLVLPAKDNNYLERLMYKNMYQTPPFHNKPGNSEIVERFHKLFCVILLM